MARVRRGKAAKTRRQFAALERWQENQGRNYAWIFTKNWHLRGFSDPNYVAEQIGKLRTILRTTERESWNETM